MCGAASDGNRLEPDASGVLGGRYRALLLPDGSTTTQVVPFVPAGVKEVTDLAGVLDDMFPRLPPRVLQAGEEWRSGDTLAIKRLSDSASLQRYHVQLSLQGPVAPPPGDSLTPTYVRTLNDRGVAAWDPARGPVRYDHAVTVEASVPVGGAIRNPARSLVEQQILLEREGRPTGRRPVPPRCSPSPSAPRLHVAGARMPASHPAMCASGRSRSIAPRSWAARDIPKTTQLSSLSPMVIPPCARSIAMPSAPSSPMPVSRMPRTFPGRACAAEVIMRSMLGRCGASAGSSEIATVRRRVMRR